MKILANFVLQHNRIGAEIIELIEIANVLPDKSERVGRRMGSRVYRRGKSNFVKDYIGNDAEGPIYPTEMFSRRFCNSKDPVQEVKRRFATIRTHVSVYENGGWKASWKTDGCGIYLSVFVY